MSRARMRRLPLPVAVMAALAILVSGCGGGDDEDAAATTTTAAGATTTTAAATTTTGDGGRDCSAAGLPATPESDPTLPEPVARTRQAIVEAAVECDYDELAALATAGGDMFTYSFGESGDPAGYWRRLEASGEEPLRYLVELLNRPRLSRGTGASEQFVWPSAYVYESWADVPADAREALKPLYDEEDFESFRQAGAYLGYRVGITAGGDWQFFVAGD